MSSGRDLSVTTDSTVSPARGPSRIALIVTAIWCVLFAVIFVRIALHPAKNTVFNTYAEAGANWLAGQDLYEGPRGFVYSPLAAAVFAPFALLPRFLGNVLWRLLNAVAFLGGVAWFLKAGYYNAIDGVRRAWVFILLLPLVVGNFNNGQVNPLIIGLLIIAIVAAGQERHMLAALCVGLATYFKIYPLAIGLLLVLVYPRQFSWRLLLALVLLGALSLVLQRPAYVQDQYRLWLTTRAADNRLEYDAQIAPRDLWLLLRLARIDLSQHAYNAIQLLSAMALAVVCAFGRWKQWPTGRISVAILALGSCWMLLCGPASESATYIMLAPAVVLALIDGFARPVPIVLRALVAASFGLLIAALTMNSFMHLPKGPVTMWVQPMAAVLFLVYSSVVVGMPSSWEKAQPQTS